MQSLTQPASLCSVLQLSLPLPRCQKSSSLNSPPQLGSLPLPQPCCRPPLLVSISPTPAAGQLGLLYFSQPCCRPPLLVSIPPNLLGQLGSLLFPQPCCRPIWLSSIHLALLQVHLARFHFPAPAAGQLGPAQFLGLPSLCPPTSFWRGSCSSHTRALQRQGTLQPSRPATQRTASTVLRTSLVGPDDKGLSQCSWMLADSLWLAPG